MKRKLIPFAVLALLQAVDLASTRMAFSVGAIELNPLVHGLGLWQVKLLACATIVLLACMTKRAGRLWALCGVYALIVGNNFAIALTHLNAHSR
jgi:Domain of unknown function (DUF5658)